jgi:DNA-binding SARP family transcriptional activator/tetratricopeptide (TPR) repeat protein/energy-coupling factor transporter ATP-binding protein EcfA2
VRCKVLQEQRRDDDCSTHETSPFEVRLYGELAVLRSGIGVTLPASKRTRALLAYLILCRRAVRRERLCDLLWDGPEDPRAALRWSLAKLRPLVDSPGRRRLIADKEQIRLELDGVPIDLYRLRELQATGFSSATTADLEWGVEVLRGELLEGLDLPDCHQYHEWYRAEREASRRLSVELRLALIARLESDPAAALVHARAWTIADPLDQSGHAAVIRLLGRIGRNKDALEQYAVCKRILGVQAGARPSLEVEQARMGLGGVSTSSAAARPPEADPEDIGQTLRLPRLTFAATSTLEPEYPLIGRHSERRLLEEFVNEQQPEATGVLLLLGEPGVGKTRLLTELTGLVLAAGGKVLSGRGFEAEMVRPYGAWMDALSSLEPQLLETQTLASVEFGKSSDGTSERARLFDTVVEQLLQLNVDGRTTLVSIDDIQWIDEASAALLHYASRALAGTKVRIACAARPGELADNFAVLRLVRTLSREAKLRQIGVSPLDADGTAALARSRFPGVDVTRVYAESGGNPMYALEVARAIEHGQGPTSSLQALLQDRLMRLDPEPRTLVSWAAIFGRAFSLDLLFRVTNLETNAFLTAVEHLERHGFIQAVDLSADTKGYDFVHDLVRRAAYQFIPEPRRRLMHLTAARALADSLGDASAGEIAHHAALGEDAELAVRYSIMAAERSLRLFAMREAAELAERGMRLVHRVGPSQRARYEVDLLGILVRADIEKRRFSELEAAMNRALQAAHAAGYELEVVRGRVALGYFHFDRGDFDAASREMLPLLAMARHGQPRDAAYALAHTAQCLALLERDIEHAESLIAEARSMNGRYESGPFEITLAEGLILNYHGDLTHGLEALARAAEAAEQQGEFWLLAVCLLHLAMGELQRGQPERALEHCGRLSGIVERLGEASEGAMGHVLAAVARRDLRQRTPAFDFDEALINLVTMDSKVYLAEAYCVVAHSDLGDGDARAAERHAQQALRAAEEMNRTTYIVWSRAILARVARERGDLAQARQQVELALPLLTAKAGPSAYARRLLSTEANRLQGVTLN